MLACLVPFAMALADAQDFAVVHRTKQLNLRSQATSSSTRLGAYEQGTWVEVIGEKNNWYQVRCPDGKTGYMSKNYLDKGPAQSVNVGVVSNPKATSYLNLRAEPSYSAEVLGIYYNGVPFRIHSYSGGWYNVTVDGLNGYFRQEYITRSYSVYADTVATIQTPNNTALNLRKGPGKGYGIIRQYRGGQYFMVLTQGDAWWKVCVDGQIGFMSSEFLKEGIHRASSPSSSTGSTANGVPYGVVTNPRSTQVLNLRQEPDTTSLVLGSFRNGTRVTILSQGSEWCQVVVDKTGDTGYMMTQYLTLYNLPSRPTRTTSHPQSSFVNLRRWSTMNAAVLTRVPHGRAVEVLIPGVDWCKVRYNGITGYMVSYFLK
ncbi:MAG: SH3 domain-containing protein [Clostridia bacterium]|nr:SH3 domain-containing protein [Clostridia bacterium]